MSTRHKLRSITPPRRLYVEMSSSSDAASFHTPESSRTMASSTDTSPKSPPSLSRGRLSCRLDTAVSIICSGGCHDTFSALTWARPLVGTDAMVLLTEPNRSQAILPAPSGCSTDDIFTVQLANSTWNISRRRLAARSDYFDRLINGQFREASAGAAVLEDDPPLAAYCMMQYFSQGYGANPPTYEVPEAVGNFYGLINAILQVQVFALAEKYMVRSLRLIALARLQKATAVTHELADIFPGHSSFSTWALNEQMALIHTVYCGRETVDLSLRNELVKAVVTMTMDQTLSLLTVRQGYPEIRHHLILGLCLLRNRDPKTHESLVSTCFTEDEIVEALGLDPSPLSIPTWPSKLAQPEDLITVANKVTDPDQRYQSWIGMRYLNVYNSEVVHEHRMLCAWIQARHLRAICKQQRDDIKLNEERLLSLREKLDKTQLSIDSLTSQTAETEAKKDRLGKLAEDVGRAASDCRRLDTAVDSFEVTQKALKDSCRALESQSVQLRAQLTDAQISHARHSSYFATYTRALEYGKRSLTETEECFEIYSVVSAKHKSVEEEQQ